MAAVGACLWIASLLVLLMLGSCGQNKPAVVSSIEVVRFGLLEIVDSANTLDATSSIGAEIAHAREMRVSHQTDRIPLRPGISYGIAFVVHGTAPDGIVEIQVVLRSSSPCVLKQTGQPVYQNDTTLRVKLGEVRHVGARIAAPEESHCKNIPGPGFETFELRYRNRKLAEKTFEVIPEGAN